MVNCPYRINRFCHEQFIQQPEFKDWFRTNTSPVNSLFPGSGLRWYVEWLCRVRMVVEGHACAGEGGREVRD